MCGIAGIINFKSEPIDPRPIKNMTESIFHRGPDDSGFFNDDNVALGFRRLSIIDLEHGHQPMESINGQYLIVFNGEIYNFKEIRKILSSLGYRFKTNCDTEVILYAFQHWGIDCIEKFNGMFAFAIYDKQKRTVFLARDRLGIKPLYYSIVDGILIFGSEMKVILEHPKFVKSANLLAISSYLTFRYPHGEATVFNGIKRLSPGHSMKIDSSGISISKYWEIPFFDTKEDLGEKFYLERTEELLAQAVRRRLISDVPLGALLSGGLDSSLIVASMCKQNNTSSRIKTYSIGFGEEGYDESHYARMVADHCGVDHLSLSLGQEDYIEQLKKTIIQKDAPLSIPHEIALMNICSELKKHTTVVISGEGADELFGGYGRVQRSPMDFKKIEYVKKLFPPSLHKPLLKLMGAGKSIDSWLAINSHLDHFFSVYNWIPFEEKWNLFTKSTMDAIDNDKPNIEFWQRDFERISGGDDYDKILYLFEKNHLSCLLDRLDSMSMAASVEARVPFVDHELVEFASTIPIKYKLKWKSPFHQAKSMFTHSFKASENLDHSKYILRKLGLKVLPKEIVSRRKKGFPVPLDNWINNGMIKYAKEILLDDKTTRRGVFRYSQLEKMLNNNQKLDYDFWGKKVWMLMNVELWFRECID